ncbi:hypothetical protein J3R83DRAFT_1276 [Lanmaoa asiatica]|nr:hypothetical protein J3R83DRAFT_1276 [Lanmaoa asiatica]
MFSQPSRYTLVYPVMLLGLVAPKFPEMTGSRNDQKLRISSECQNPAPEEKVTPAQIVDEIAQKVLSGMPLRFINLNTGTFTSSTELLRIFKRSPGYQTLVTDKVLTSDELAEQAEDVIRKYFAYVMLSHVWGEEEPLYGDVKLITNVLEMSPSSPGTLKLQNFAA